MQHAVVISFYQATQNLREAMESDLPLTEVDELSLENHIALLQLAYMEWKRRRNRASSAYPSAA
jgi:hypothetical protein